MRLVLASATVRSERCVSQNGGIFCFLEREGGG